MNQYLNFGIRLAADLTAVLILAFGIYLRASRRRDVAASLVALNVGLVAVLTALMAMPNAGTGGLTVGFGLFAVLSIIRLRSEASSLTEVAYFFTALALGVVNGVELDTLGLMAVLDVVLVGGMAALELTRRSGDAERQVVVADEVFGSRAALSEHLARRLGARILEVRVLEVDFVRETTRVEALVVDDGTGAAGAGPSAHDLALRRGGGRFRRAADRESLVGASDPGGSR